MKKTFKVCVLFLVLSFLFLTLFSACGNNQTGSGKQNGQSAENGNADAKGEGKKLKIAYVANFLSHEFYQRCIEGMKVEAEALGVELLIADSNSDVNTQINNFDNYISQKVDAIMLTPIDPNAVAGSVKKAKEAGIPTITESNPVEGAVTMVGADWYSNGKQMGKWTGEYLKANNIKGKVLIIGFPAFQDTSNVEKGFIEALKETGADAEIVANVDGQAVKEQSLVVATDALTANPDINVIMGINDDSALGGIQAYKSAGKDISKLVSLSHGLEGNAGCKAIAEEKSLTAAYALFPEVYGQSMLRAAVAAVKGEELPELYKSPMTMVTAENLGSFYVKEGEEYKLDFESAKKLLEE